MYKIYRNGGNYDKFIETFIEGMERLCYAISINLSKGCEYMPTIAPVSDLRNYGNVLEKVSEGSPVYLTRNGHGAYSIRDMKDEEHFQKAEAMIQLMCESNAGIRSAEEEGWISEEDFRSHFKNRRNDR